jgi:hypothetical protein
VRKAGTAIAQLRALNLKTIVASSEGREGRNAKLVFGNMQMSEVFPPADKGLVVASIFFFAPFAAVALGSPVESGLNVQS